MNSIAICTTFKNEARYIEEWLNYHAFLGVTKFFLYDNNSTDDSCAIIAAWNGPASINVTKWPYIPGQIKAYSDMIARHRTESEWCAFIDCDEFLCPQTDMDFPSILAQTPSLTSLFVHWRIFGSSGQTAYISGNVTERFTMRSKDDFSPNCIGKSIVRLSQAEDHVENCHLIRTRAPMLNDRGDEVNQYGGGIHYRSSYKLIALNHYFTKSLEEWHCRRSLGRATISPDATDFRRTERDFHLHDRNDIEDLRARRITQEIAKTQRHYAGS